MLDAGWYAAADAGCMHRLLGWKYWQTIEEARPAFEPIQRRLHP